MTNLEITQIFSAEDLKVLYDDSALTMTGLCKESIPDFVAWIEERTKLIRKKVYVIDGETMNVYCGNTGDNCYADDLTFVAVKLSDLKEYEKIVLPRFEIGGRWFDDIVDNNRRREEEKIAKTLNDDDELIVNED